MPSGHFTPPPQLAIRGELSSGAARKHMHCSLNKIDITRYTRESRAHLDECVRTSDRSCVCIRNYERQREYVTDIINANEGSLGKFRPGGICRKGAKWNAITWKNIYVMLFRRRCII